MYRRYSQVGDGSMPLSQLKRNRLKNVVILLLVIALGALLFISLPLMRAKGRSWVMAARAEISCTLPISPFAVWMLTSTQSSLRV